jgi:hypothetical protein
MQPAVAPRAELRPAATAAARPLIELAGVAKTYRTRDGEVE